MKSRMNCLLSIAIALVAAAAANAQTLTVDASVPFEFHAGNRMFPAGSYRVTSSDSNTVAWFSGKHGMQGMTTVRAAGENESQPPCLIFHKYGGEYFLAQIWTGRAIGQNVPMTTREKELASVGVPRALTIVRVSVVH